MRVLYNNLIWDSTVTNTNANANYPIANIKDSRLSKYYRSVNDNDMYFVIDTGSAVALTYFAIMSHNISSGATLTLEANATDVWTTPSFTTTLTHGDGIILENFTEQSYRYYRLTVSDNSNPDEYIQIGGLYLSNHAQFPAMEQKQSLGRSSTSKKQISDSGQLYVNRKYKYKTRKADFPFVTWSQAESIDGVFDYVDYPIILMLYEANLANEPAIYAHIDGDSFVLDRNGNVTNPFKTSFNFRQIF